MIKISRRIWLTLTFRTRIWIETEDGLESDDDDLDSVAGFDSPAPFDDESLDDTVPPLVAGVAGVAAESDSVLLGVLFFA